MLARRSFLGLVALSLAFLVAPAARANDDEVPSALAAQLFVKIATLDKNFAARRLAHPRILVVRHGGDDRSARSASQLASYLAEVDDRRFPVDTVTYVTPGALVSELDAHAACIVVLTTGLEGDMPAIASAFSGKDVLTVGSTGTLVDRGANAGTEVRSGKPKIVVNLSTARAQNVSFRAELLNLARIVP